MRGSEQQGNPGWSPWVPPTKPSYFNGLGNQKHSPFEDGMNYILFPTHHLSPQDQVLLNPVLPWHSCHWNYFHSPGHPRSSILPFWVNEMMNEFINTGPYHTVNKGEFVIGTQSFRFDIERCLLRVLWAYPLYWALYELKYTTSKESVAK